MNAGFGDNIRVEAVAKIDGVDVIAAGHSVSKSSLVVIVPDPSLVQRRIRQKGKPPRRSDSRGHVPFQIAIHDGEEDL
jgi:hypothetical protein